MNCKKDFLSLRYKYLPIEEGPIRNNRTKRQCKWVTEVSKLPERIKKMKYVGTLWIYKGLMSF